MFTGCVGDDDLAEQLKAANKREGLDEVYLVKKGEKTGACAVVITGHNRLEFSLFSNVIFIFNYAGLLLPIYELPRNLIFRISLRLLSPH